MRKKPISKKMIIFFTGILSLLFIFCSLLIIKIVLKDDLLNNMTGFIIGGIGTITGIVMTGRVADDYQIGINFKKELAEKDEE